MIDLFLVLNISYGHVIRMIAKYFSNLSDFAVYIMPLSNVVIILLHQSITRVITKCRFPTGTKN